MSYAVIHSSQQPQIISTSRTEDSSQPIAAPILIDDPLTCANLFLNTLYEKKIIDQKGFLIKDCSLPPMIMLGKTSMERLNAILATSLQIQAFDSVKKITLKNFLLQLDLSKGRIHLVGGIVPWILGSESFNEAGSLLLGEEFFKKIYGNEYLSHFDDRKGDIDIRFKMNSELSELDKEHADPQWAAESFLKNLAKTFHPSIHSESNICDELRKKGGPFSVFHPFFDIEKGNIDRQAFRINFKDGNEFELDLLIASILKKDSLLTCQDLTVDITDYLQDSNVRLKPEGNLFLGWQAIIALLGRLIQLKNLSPHAWARAQSKKIAGFKMLEGYPDELYTRLKPKALGSILQSIIDGHTGRFPIAALMLVIDCLSDLVQNGFHQIDIDQIVQQIKIIEPLPSELKGVRSAMNLMPFDLILAILRLTLHTKNDSQGKEQMSFLTWHYQSYEATIQLSLEKAIELLIQYEMQLKKTESNTGSQTLIDLFAVFQCKIIAERLIGLQIVENRCPKLLKYACECYLKNREDNISLVYELSHALLSSHLQAASQLFLIHLNHTSMLENRHVELFSLLCQQHFLSNNQAQLLEAIHTIVPMAKKICQSESILETKINRLLEDHALSFLRRNKPRTSAYLLKLGKESGLKLGNGDLWLQCVENIFNLNTLQSKQEAMQLWTFADRHGIRLKKNRSKEQLPFYIDFIEALYHQNTPEYLLLGDSLQDWLPLKEKYGELASRIQALIDLKKKNVLEFEVSQKNIQSMFEYLEAWTSNQGNCPFDKIKNIFIDLAKLVAESGKTSWQSNMNRILHLLPKIHPFFADLQVPILNILETALLSGYQSSVLLEILAFILRETPFIDRNLSILITAIKESSSQFSSQELNLILTKNQKFYFEELFRLGKHVEILHLLNYIGQNTDKLIKEESFYFETFLVALLTCIENSKLEDKKSSSFAYQYILLASTILKSTYPEDKVIGLAERTLLACLIDSMQNYLESSFWIQKYLDSIWQNPETLSKEDFYKLFTWAESLINQGMYLGALNCLKYIFKHASEMQGVIFKLIVSLPDEILSEVTMPITKIFKKGITNQKEVLNNLHVRTKIRKLAKILLAFPFQPKKISAALYFLECKLDDSSHTLLNALKACQSMPLELAFRSWKLFRIRFKEFLLEEENDLASNSTFLKCQKTSIQILKNLRNKNFQPAIQEIKQILEYYKDQSTPLGDWIVNPIKKIIVLEDIGNLLLAGYPPYHAKELSLDQIVKNHSMRLFLSNFKIEFHNSNPKEKEIFSLFQEHDHAMTYHMLRKKGTTIFMKGLRIFKALALDAKTMPTHFVDLLELALSNTIEISYEYQEVSEKLLLELFDLFMKFKPNRLEAERIAKVLNNHPLIKEDDGSGLSESQQQIKRSIRAFLGISTIRDKIIEKEEKVAKKSSKKPERCGNILCTFDEAFFIKGFKISSCMVVIGLLLLILGELQEGSK